MSWYFYILGSSSALPCSLRDVWWSEPDPFLHSFSGFPAFGLLVLGWYLYVARLYAALPDLLWQLGSCSSHNYTRLSADSCVFPLLAT